MIFPRAQLLRNREAQRQSSKALVILEVKARRVLGSRSNKQVFNMAAIVRCYYDITNITIIAFISIIILLRLLTVLYCQYHCYYFYSYYCWLYFVLTVALRCASGSFIPTFCSCLLVVSEERRGSENLY